MLNGFGNKQYNSTCFEIYENGESINKTFAKDPRFEAPYLREKYHPGLLSNDSIEEENLSTKVTDDDLANAWTDEFGVKYSPDKKRLLKAPRLFHSAILRGTIVICDNAFSEYNSLQKIVIPDTVRVIGNRAFYWSFDLRWINIPSSVRRIGDNPFAGCTNLETIICESPNYKFSDNALYTSDMKILVSCLCKDSSFVIPNKLIN
jgi:hypothetical protein